LVGPRLPSDSDRARVETAIRAAEARTSGELVAVVAAASERYQFEPTLVAAVAALLVPAVLWVPGITASLTTIYVAQLVVFAVLLPILLWQPVARWLVPQRVRRENAERLAQAQFQAQGLDRTEHATGVLIFVSLAEHHVQILADRGIDERVAPDAWNGIVEGLVAAIRADRMTDGLVAAIERCAALLAEHFPRRPDDRNELPDRLVEI
jgi:putative membrane protein